MALAGVAGCLLFSASASGGGEVSGRVLATDGRPVAGASVKLYYRHEQSDYGARWLAETKSDGQGAFRVTWGDFEKPLIFLSTPTMRVHLVVSHPGHAVCVEPLAWGRTTDLAVRLGKARSVRCLVVDPAGGPVEGAQVKVEQEPNPRGRVVAYFGVSDSVEPLRLIGEVYQRRTDAAGSAAVDGLPSGPLIFYAEHADKGTGFARATDEDSVVRIMLKYKWERITGTVKDSQTGKPLAGMVVSLMSLWGTVDDWTTTDAGGAYRFQFSPASAMGAVRGRGTGGLAVYDPSPAPAYCAGAVLIPAAEPKEERRVDVDMVGGTPAKGVAVDARTRRPVADAAIMVMVAADRQLRAIRAYRRTDAEGAFSIRATGERVFGGVQTAPPGYVRTGVWNYQRLNGGPGGRSRPILVEMAKEVVLDLDVRKPDGLPAAGVELIAGQSGVDEVLSAVTDAQGRARLAGLAETFDAFFYAATGDGSLAGKMLLPKVAAAAKPVELRLVTGRSGRIVMEDQNGIKLGGMVLIRLDMGGERFGMPFRYLRIEDAAAQEGMWVSGLLPDTDYMVSGVAVGQRMAGAARGTKWRFGEKDETPTLVVKFERRPGGVVPRPRALRSGGAPAARTAEDLKRDVESLQDVVSKREDPVQKHLVWYVEQVGLAVADSQKNTLTRYKGILGHDEIRVTGIAFGTDQVWVGTDKGLIAWDRKRQYWSLYAVGRAHMDAPVEKLSMGEDGKLRVTVRVAEREPLDYEYDTAKQEWTGR